MKKKNKFYFSEKIDDYIILYNNEKDHHKKNIIYEKHLNKPFNKLIENIINTFKFYYNEENDSLRDLQHEVLVFLLSKINLYKKENGRSFSYFGTIAKRYLILENQRAYNKLKQQDSLNIIEINENSSSNNKSKESNKDLINKLILNENTTKTNYNENILNLIKKVNKVIENDNTMSNEEKNISYLILNIIKYQENEDIIKDKKVLIQVIKFQYFNTSNFIINKIINKIKNIYYNNNF